MITKTYICDITGKSVGESDLCEIKVDINILRDNTSIYGGTYRTFKTVSKHICKEELIRRGLLVELPEGDPKREEEIKRAKKTFEDKFLDLLEDLGVVFQE